MDRADESKLSQHRGTAGGIDEERGWMKRRKKYLMGHRRMVGHEEVNRSRLQRRASDMVEPGAQIRFAMVRVTRQRQFMLKQQGV